MFFDTNPANETLHYAWRITYTHIDGTEKETTLCQGWRSSWEELFKASRGIAAVDCIGKLHFHDSSCDDRGEVLGHDFTDPKWREKND